MENIKLLSYNTFFSWLKYCTRKLGKVNKYTEYNKLPDKIRPKTMRGKANTRKMLRPKPGLKYTF